jgi:hypothetical protein
VFPLVFLGGAVLVLWWIGKNAPAKGAAPASHATQASLAEQLNAVLLSGTPTAQQAALTAYEKAKGLPMTGLYTSAIQHAMVDDGVVNPAPVPAGTTED